MNETLLKTQRALLFIAGAILVAVGVFILVSPHAFFASNDIYPGENVSLLNELKAPAVLLLGAGAFVVAGGFRRSLSDPATWLAALVYLSYAASRALSMGVDGMPAEGLVQAAVLEGALGLLCLAIMAVRRDPDTGRA